MARFALTLHLVALAAISVPASARQAVAPKQKAETVEIVRDKYGVPHILAETDRGALFGLGHACAEDRAFQMSLNRIVIRGETARYFGRGVADRYLDHDYRMRLYGYYRIAEKVVATMDATTLELVQAYADGVNARLAGATELHPYFELYGIPVGAADPWSARDVVAMWFRVARRFTPAEPSKQISILHELEECLQTNDVDGCRNIIFPDQVFDETAAVVQFSDPLRTDEVAATEWLAEPSHDPGCGGPDPGLGGVNCVDDKGDGGSPLVPDRNTTCAGHWLGHFIQDGNELDEDGFARPITFSHTWAVAGSGPRPAAIFGDPRIPIRIPAAMWEAHVRGKTFEVRGATFAGSPNFIVGSTRDVSWSVTALAMAQTDLYELTVDEMNVADPGDDVYLLDGQWLEFEYAPEVIEILGETAVQVDVRQSRWGFVITEYPGDQRFSNQIEPDEVFAAMWVPNFLTDPELAGNPDFDWRAHSESGFFDMYRATDVASFRAALGGWTVPGINCAYADSAGHVGYSVVGANPLRSRCAPLAGDAATDGTDTRNRWEAIIPNEFLPWVEKVRTTQTTASTNFVYSANHLPVSNSWYPLPLVKRGGHNNRSRRIQERLLALDNTSVDSLADTRAVHSDGALAHSRDMTLLLDHYRAITNTLGATYDPGHPYNTDPAYPALPADVVASLDVLRAWALQGGVLRRDQPKASALGHWLGQSKRHFRPNTTVAQEIVDWYGTAGAGLHHFLRVLTGKVLQGDASEADRCPPNANGLLCPDDVHALIAMMHAAWLTTLQVAGPDPDADWAPWFTDQHLKRPRTSSLLTDCNCNQQLDSEDILLGSSPDCNGNNIPDECDIARLRSRDCNGNGIPDECDGLPPGDCNCNGIDDAVDIAMETSVDCDEDGTPDECQYKAASSGCLVDGLERWIDIEQLESVWDPSDPPRHIDIPAGQLDVASTGTVLSQLEQTYSNWVVLPPNGVPIAQSVLPFGQHEILLENDPESQADLWLDQRLKAAPMEDFEPPLEIQVIYAPRRWQGGPPNNL